MITTFKIKFEDTVIEFVEGNGGLLTYHLVPNLDKEIQLSGSDAINSIKKVIRLTDALPAHRRSFLSKELNNFIQRNGITKEKGSSRAAPRWLLGVDYSPSASLSIGNLIKVTYKVTAGTLL